MNNLIIFENDNYILNPIVSEQLAGFEKTVKELKEKEEKLKAIILEEMEKAKILKLETPDLTISYIAPTDRESFDSKAFKVEHQDLYDEYIKMTPVKSSIRIKVN